MRWPAVGLVGQRSHGRGGGGDGRADHAEHAVVAGELVEGVGGFGGVALVVHGLELDLLAVDAALGVDLIHSQLEAGDLGLAVCGGGAGVGGDGAQRDGIAVGRATVGAAGIVHAAAGAGSEGHRHCACRDQGDALGGELRVHSVLPLFLKTLHIPFNAHLGKNHVHLNPRARNHGDHS